MLPGLGQGCTQRPDRQRIFGADVDDGPAGTYRVGADGQTFQYLVGVAFQDGAIHVGPGIAFIGIADDDFCVGLDCGGHFPLGPGGKAGPAAPAEPGTFNRCDYLVGGQPESLDQGRVPARGDILVDALRVDLAALFHDNPFFLVETGKLHHGRNHLVFHSGAEYMLEARIPLFQEQFGQHPGLARRDFMVEHRREPGSRVVDNDHRLRIAVAVAANRVYLGRNPPLFQCFFKCGPGIQCPGGNPAGGHANVDFRYRSLFKCGALCFRRLAEGIILLPGLGVVRTHSFAFLFPPSLFRFGCA